MHKIEIILLNPDSINEGVKMAQFAARLTQKGHDLNSFRKIYDLYNKEINSGFIKTLTELPHPTLQKFSVINICVVGASRRFLAQITRHQNEVKFMSTSLQYSDYTNHANFVVPYNLIDTPYEADYLSKCYDAAEEYKFITENTDNDTAGYVMPQSLRNVLIISATPYQWRHMIRQRICRRNTDETRYVMLKCWEILQLNDKYGFFDNCLPDCCKEGKFSCKHPIDKNANASEILRCDFAKIYKEV